MPLYEYKCQDCGETVELIQKFSDPPLTECKVCGGHMERVLSAPAIQFKGSGWYVTDYGHRNGSVSSHRRDSSSKDEKGASSSESTAGSKESKNTAKDS